MFRIIPRDREFLFLFLAPVSAHDDVIDLIQREAFPKAARR
jgi:hypothetical protein